MREAESGCLGCRKEGWNSGGHGDLRGLAGGHTLRQEVDRMASKGVGSLGREKFIELVIVQRARRLVRQEWRV